MEQEFKGKKLVLLGGIKTACSIVEKAQEMGAYVIVMDYNLDSPAKQIADEAVLIDATDVNAIVAWCREHKVDGITTGFVDILMPICYEVCKELGLPYYATPKMLSMSTNKVDFKETCRQYGVPVPKTYLIGSEIPAEVYDRIQYPVFVKPLDSSGSRGAGACRTKEELDRQFAEAVGYSPTNTAVIEDYITGREFLLDYVGVDGEFKLLSMFDRYMSPGRGSAINYSNVCLCPAKQIDQYYEEANPTCYSNPNYLEIFMKEAGKGSAVVRLSRYLNIPIENTIAAGDEQNDISMIEEAGLGIAMINAGDIVKKSADVITVYDNNNDGLAEFIK